MAVTRIRIPAAWERTQEADERLEMSLSELDMSVRTVNFLEDDGIFTVLDLLNCTVDRLLGIKNVGPTTIKSIFVALAKIGFGVPVPSGKEQAEGGYVLLR
jgi:DNA-directed RNA polymerase alpha subunit